MAGDEGRAAAGPPMASPGPRRRPGKGAPVTGFESHFQLWDEQDVHRLSLRES